MSTATARDSSARPSHKKPGHHIEPDRRIKRGRRIQPYRRIETRGDSLKRTVPSIPPLAIAVLVGYAVDVFFSFLEGLLQAFTKTKTAAIPKPVVPTAGAKA